MKFRGGPAAVIGDVGDKARRRQGDEPATGGDHPAGKASATDDPRARRPAGSDSRGRDPMERISASLAPADVLHCASEKIVKTSTIPAAKKPRPQPRPDVIAIRKTCDAEGTGLSHYVLMDKQVKR